MERRGFLSFMTAAAAGLFLPDTLIVEPSKFKTVVPADFSAVDLTTITKALNSEFERLMSFPDFYYNPSGYKIGEHFTKQFNIQMALPLGEVKDIHERFISPGAEALANACKNAKITKFGNLALPVTGGLESARVNAIRAVRYPYCMFCDNVGPCRTCGRIDNREMFRFDVLGG